MSERQTIALLIPAYNAAAYLPRLLNSAYAQTEPFDEIWVYDDCSTDSTAEVAAAHGAQVVVGDVNRGCSTAKNELARKVKTDWLHFHDADDELLPNFVALARKWINSAKCPDVVLFDYLYKDNDTGDLLSKRSFNSKQLSEDPIRYAIREQINPFCGLYRRSSYWAAGGYDEDPAVLYNEDVAFHVRLALSGLTFAAENEVSIINYRIGGSMSAGNQHKCLAAHFTVMRRALENPRAAPYRMDVAQKLWAVAGRLAAFDDWERADEAARLANEICQPADIAGSRIFRTAARISPQLALRLRERWVRLAKPELRAV